VNAHRARKRQGRSRAFGALLALALLAAPLAAEGQPAVPKTARIGYVSIRSGPADFEEAFRQRLHELGYVEGQNISIEYRWADLKPDRIPALAEELVRLKVDVIVSSGGAVTALAVKKAVRAIPVVFISGDPVRAGLVASLARPGGNLTGVSTFSRELNSKRLELLKEAMPGISRVAVLANLAGPFTGANLKELEGAARALGVKLQVLGVRDPQEIDEAFSAMTRERAGALLVLSDAMFLPQRERIVGLAAKIRLPAMFEWREFAEAGGLLSYDTSLGDLYRQLATYVDKILKGAKPADLPVERPTRFELVINAKTAKALGLTIPPSLLLRADHVIQ
jgi:putative ABC transport system substrate-binding protein